MLNRKSDVSIAVRRIVVVLTMLLSACSPGMEGTYSGTVPDATGTMKVQLTFSSDGQVVTSVGGIQQTKGTYEIQDDQVKIIMVDGDELTGKLLEDGTLQLQAPEPQGGAVRLRPIEQ